MLAAVLDNDIVLKGVAYGLLPEMAIAIPAEQNQCGVLGTASFVVAQKLRARGLSEKADALSEHLSALRVLEPTDDEVHFASELEVLAHHLPVSLDHGESLLCAIVVTRSIPRFVTGDKRAVVAIENIHVNSGLILWLAGRLVCLEQIFRRMLDNHEPRRIRQLVCALPDVDTALAICFSCTSTIDDSTSWIAGLESYIADLRGNAPSVLAV